MLQAFRCENTFKFRDIENKIKSKAPYLLELFQHLASRQRNLMYDTAAKRRGDTDDWVDEEILDDATMDVDEGNMEFSDAYGDTEADHITVGIQPQGLTEEAEVESCISGHTSEDDNMWDSASEVEDKRNILSRNVKRGRRLVTTAISALCYSRSTNSNLLQAQMGHYFLCARTPKRPVEVAHQLGISVSYSSIAKALEAIAKSVKEHVRTFAKQWPAFFISFDNMNIFDRKKGERLQNQGGMLNLTSAWLGINPKSSSKRMFTSADVDISRASRLQTSDLLPNEINLRRNLNTSQYGLYSTLKTYFGGQMSSFLRRDGSQLEPVVIAKIKLLPQQKSIMYTFPCFDKNEAIISEVTEILQSMMKQMDLKGVDLVDKKVMHKGDWLTVRNMVYAPSLNISSLVME